MPVKLEHGNFKQSAITVEKRRLWRKALGDIGEQIVSRFLILNEWQIVCTKFRVGRSSEVDIVAISPDGVTVFIEVKTRTIWSSATSTWYESAAQAIDARKQKRIISASRRFQIANHGLENSNFRYDVFIVGLSYKLALNLTDLKTDCDKSLELVNEIDYQISQFQSLKGSANLELIHCESAFLTNF